ncbi:MAG: isoprenyl transferase [Oscillospiraceae bacterium]|nr:isoprenyl transferase [Oscillospiraceae bacterium]
MGEETELKIPRHIGIIMDGNGRWAKKRLLPRSAGHVKGAEVFRTITRHCEKLGVEALTVYAFSTENWSRPKGEIEGIMNLMRSYLRDAFTFEGENIKIRFIGERSALASDIVELMESLEATSRENTGLILNIAFNYGGREEICRAARLLAARVASGELKVEDIDQELFGSLTYTASCPEVDMILRPSGEERLSNFLLWQSAYSEFVFMDTLWPDFTPEKLEEAIEIYSSRSRRFGASE